MMAFSSAILDVPMARDMVMMEARASGMAATARATAKSRASVSRHASVQAERKDDGADDHDGDGKLLAEVVHGDLQRSLALSDVSFIRSAILPSSVLLPTPVMMARPRPYVTSEPEKTMLS
jgi:hypothetical protein